jgi:EF-P beta-lysylation protein EpmB
MKLTAFPAGTTPPWQISLTNAITDIRELFEILELDICTLPATQLANRDFELRVPRGFVNRIKKRDPFDPLLQQILPVHSELEYQPGYLKDPLEEVHANPIPGLLHKYRGRVLLTVTGGCAIHCRYCFRRHFPYENNNPGRHGWDRAIQYIEQDTTIKEVILSGGDPLLATDTHLQELIFKINNIPHIKTVRIHTRLPIVLPERMTESLLAWMTHTRLRMVLVTHCNHAQEINEEVKRYLQPFKDNNIILLNQSVLLKGVNDSVNALCDLSEALFDCGILPYYLHVLDKVQGAAHFDVDENTAKTLAWEMMGQLPGYLVPRLVREKAGAPSKVPICVNN